jgi:hypothetical protein
MPFLQSRLDQFEFFLQDETTPAVNLKSPPLISYKHMIVRDIPPAFEHP